MRNRSPSLSSPSATNLKRQRAMRKKSKVDLVEVLTGLDNEALTQLPEVHDAFCDLTERLQELAHRYSHIVQKEQRIRDPETSRQIKRELGENGNASIEFDVII